MKPPISCKWIAPVCLGAGALAAALRLWLKTTAGSQGLLPEGHPASTALLILTGAVLLFLALCKPQRPVRVKFPAEAIGAFAAALGVLLSDVLGTEEPGSFMLLLALLAVVCLCGLGFFRLRGKPAPLLLPILITVYMMLSPLQSYRQWSAQSQLLSYFFPVLCAVFLMQRCLQVTFAEGGNKKPWALQFFTCGSLFFSLTCLTDDRWPFYVGMALWCFSGSFRTVPAMVLPKDTALCIRTLEDAGFEAYAVGGCVRDFLMGNTPQDYDICTSATPEEICDVFQNRTLIHNGEKHGTVGVVIRKQVYEITTFRTEGGYSDNRHPDWVKFVTDIQADLARRDFTINAMAYSPRTGYIDPFGGQDDLEKGILRCVGEPEARFTEDSLRILRGIRFAARLGFQVDPATEKAMFSLAPLMDSLARERVWDELCKFLPCAKAEDLIRFAPILVQVIPELKDCVGFDQCNHHHAYDVFTHTAHVVEAVHTDPALRWAALLHDVAKPKTFTLDESGTGHFLGHAAESAHMADHILHQLRAPTDLREKVVFLIEQHMTSLTPDRKLLRRRISRWGADNVLNLLTLQKADFSSKGTGKKSDGAEFAQVEELLEQILSEDACLTLRDLAVSGGDLMALGFAPGPKLGDCLNFLLSLVVDEVIPNEKDMLLAKAKEYLEQ